MHVHRPQPPDRVNLHAGIMFASWILFPLTLCAPISSRRAFVITSLFWVQSDISSTSLTVCSTRPIQRLTPVEPSFSIFHFKNLGFHRLLDERSLAPRCLLLSIPSQGSRGLYFFIGFSPFSRCQNGPQTLDLK